MMSGSETAGWTVVVGGGIAGLCAASNLAERGAPVLLLERNPVSFGGRVSSSPPTTFEHEGRTWRFSTEHGMHGWWRQYRNLLSFYERHGLAHTLVPAEDQALFYRDTTRFSRVNVGRRTQVTRVPEPIHHLPLLGDPTFRKLLKPKELANLAVLVKRVAEILAFDPYDPADRRRYDGRSVQEFLPGMPFIFKAFMRSLTRSGFFSDPPVVSLWAFLLSLQLYVFLRREDQCFDFMRGRVAELFCDPLVARIRERGGVAARGISVEGIERHGEGEWRIHWKRLEGAPPADGGALAGDGGVIRAAQVILAVDVEGAKTLSATSPCVAEQLGDLSTFRGRASTNVRLFFSKSPTADYAESGVFAGKFTADNYFWLHRFQDEFKAFHRETGGGVSECHIYAPERLHQLPDEVLMARVQKDMEDAFPEVAGTCVHRVIVRNAPTHINFPVGCAQSFPTVRTALPDLAFAGDWVDGGVPVLYMERACQTGIMAANTVLVRCGLEPFPILHPNPPPRHVQLIQRVLRIPRLVRRGERAATRAA